MVLGGSADVVVKVKGAANGEIKLSCEKARHSPHFKPRWMRLHPFADNAVALPLDDRTASEGNPARLLSESAKVLGVLSKTPGSVYGTQTIMTGTGLTRNQVNYYLQNLVKSGAVQ